MTFDANFNCGIAAYSSLVNERGMMPAHRLSRLGDESWELCLPGRHASLIDTDEALHLMAYEALLWLRNHVGYDIDVDSLTDLNPSTVLCRVRQAADLVLTK